MKVETIGQLASLSAVKVNSVLKIRKPKLTTLKEALEPYMETPGKARSPSPTLVRDSSSNTNTNLSINIKPLSDREMNLEINSIGQRVDKKSKDMFKKFM